MGRVIKILTCTPRLHEHEHEPVSSDRIMRYDHGSKTSKVQENCADVTSSKEPPEAAKLLWKNCHWMFKESASLWS